MERQLNPILHILWTHIFCAQAKKCIIIYKMILYRKQFLNLNLQINSHSQKNFNLHWNKIFSQYVLVQTNYYNKIPYCLKVRVQAQQDWLKEQNQIQIRIFYINFVHFRTVSLRLIRNNNPFSLIALLFFLLSK